MSLFARSAVRTPLVLLEVGSGFVAAAYLAYGGARKPVLHHAVRLPLQSIPEMASTAKEALAQLVRTGAPELRSALGHARATSALVVLRSPWQQTRAVCASRAADAPFNYTKTIENELCAEAIAPPPGSMLVSSRVLSTTLNGYEVSKPYGKRATRAEVRVLCATIDAVVKDELSALLGSAHIEHAVFTTLPWVSSWAVANLFPHESAYLIIDAAARATDFTLVANGKVAGATAATEGVRVLEQNRPLDGGKSSVEHGIRIRRDFALGSALEEGKTAWLASTAAALRMLAKEHALPRTVFLLAEPPIAPFISALMNDERIRSLWLADEPLSIIPLLPAQLGSKVVADHPEAADAALLLTGQYAAAHAA